MPGSGRGSKLSGGKGRSKTSAWRKVTLRSPAASVRARACSSDPAERSMLVNRAPGLFRARITVWAPTPQPASSTELPAG